MTIFGQCHNVLNNNAGYPLYVRAMYIEFTMTIFEQCHNVLNNNRGDSF